MITFSLMLDDCPRAMRREDNTFFLGERSNITAFAHPAIALDMILGEGRWLIFVYEIGQEKHPIGEGSSPGATAVLSEKVYDAAFREIVAHSNELFAIECTYGAGAVRLRLLSGSNGTCPIYVSGAGSTLTGSWDILALVRGHSSKRFDEQFLIHSAYRAVYSTRTPYHGVMMMPPYSIVCWDGGAPNIYLPEQDPDEDIISSMDAMEARAQFNALINKVWDTRALIPKKAAVELSGGYDSSAVALSFAHRFGHGAQHLSILVLDPVIRESQAARIAAVAAACMAKSRSILMRDHLPSYAKLDRLQSLYYQSESYYSAFHTIWTEAENAGAEVVLSGHGGDELFPTFEGEEFEVDRLRDKIGPRPSAVERQFINCLTSSARELAEAPLWGAAPVSPSRISALAAMARHTPLVMQEGLWPVYPLCNVPLVRFCHALPFELRFEKALLLNLIEYFAPNTTTFKNYNKETFLEADIAGLLRDEDTIKSSSRNMLVYDLGIVSAQQFRNHIDQYYEYGSTHLLHHICSIYHLEAFLRESANA